MRQRAGERKQAEDLYREGVGKLKVANPKSRKESNVTKTRRKKKNFKENEAGFCLWNFVDQHFSKSVLWTIRHTVYLMEVGKYSIYCQVNLKDTT